MLQLPDFDTVIDQVGNQHRVHKDCVEDAEEDCVSITAAYVPVSMSSDDE
jgi:hypothetical protein